ncbi:hypothetical protein ACBY01_13425 [Sphingomonas sp. ac-8]|uniref:hypothetical protein n=1 Tax=Sphingomonas sp. ac-8 TaxID=3242977 RepID=UPI003A80F9B1
MRKLARHLFDGARMTDAEYRANLNGINIFFGAVLGFVLAGTETLETAGFTLVLVLCSAIVISILYISSSRRRLVYFLYTALGIACLPQVVTLIGPAGTTLPPKLIPTLAVWTAMTAFVEFAPRVQPEGTTRRP